MPGSAVNIAMEADERNKLSAQATTEVLCPAAAVNAISRPRYKAGQFTLNVAIWLGLMIFHIARKKESTLFSLYTSAVVINLGAYASYMLSEKLIGLLIRTGTVIYGNHWLLFSKPYPALPIPKLY